MATSNDITIADGDSSWLSFLLLGTFLVSASFSNALKFI